MAIIPPYLKNGDTIGIICPSGYMPFEKMQSCVDALQQWGFNVKSGKTAGHQYHYFSGTDEERLHDLQTMLDDDNIKAILCARGGYGLSRIIDAIDFTKFVQHPKWIIGYSDITLLHTHLQNKYNIASLHSPMAGAFNDGLNKYVQSLHNAITGMSEKYITATHPFNKTGEANGVLIGGNLSLLVHAIGTDSDIDTTDKILFIEDIGEYLYNIDRMMMQLKRASKLDKLRGLIIGGFTEMKDTVIPFGQDVYELVYDKIMQYKYPVCFNFPVGHQQENYALKTGVQYLLTVSENEVVLRENI
jgi:muramoyltetrapeptide carboxypeptidase